MPEPTFSMTADDDLPRTIRRERDAQREAREREARERQPAVAAPAAEPSARSRSASRLAAGHRHRHRRAVLRLMKFFIKAVFAAIPALIVLTALLWLFGQGLQMFFPQLLKMKMDVQIYSPQSAADFRAVGKERR